MIWYGDSLVECLRRGTLNDKPPEPPFPDLCAGAPAAWQQAFGGGGAEAYGIWGAPARTRRGAACFALLRRVHIGVGGEAPRHGRHNVLRKHVCKP